LLPAMAACPGLTVTAVASRSADRAAEVAGRYGARPVAGYHGLLDDPDVEAVYVPLPAALHAVWTRRALESGRHVLVEKPMATDPDTTRHLLSAARARGLVLHENVMFVQHGRHEAVRRLVSDGRIGRPRTFDATFTIPPLPEDDIRYRAELGGGALFDIGIYPLRAAQHLLGPDIEVLGAALTVPAGREVETGGAALLRSGDVLAHVTFGMDHCYRSRYEFGGTHGRIVVERAFTPPADYEAEIKLETAAGTEHIVVGRDDQVARTVGAFAAAVRSGAHDEEYDRAVLVQAVLLDRVARSNPTERQPRCR
jgi:dTDP-3,4-didehydro-2,6-dideoxy-alpha-D-glucose 3-reductase